MTRLRATAPGPLRVETGPEWRRLLPWLVARALVGTAASLVLWSLVPLVLGWTPRLIMSGSMSPQIGVGDVVVTRPVPDSTALGRGQVLTVADPDHAGRTRTHRLVGQDPDGRLVTRGDANRQDDSSHVARDQVQGVAVLRVPVIGRPVVWVAERAWVPVGVTLVLFGWALGTLLRGPSEGTGSAAGRRRVVAAAAVGVVAVSAAGPADAAFVRQLTNTSSTLSAASTFYAYRTAVLADAPYLDWKLDETSGTAVADSSGNNHPAALTGSATLNQTGSLKELPNRAYLSTTGMLTSTMSVVGPNAFSVEAWISTSSTTGGRIIGFGNGSGSTASTTVDRQLYLAPTGKVYFGIGATKTVVASTAAVNNGAWHHVVGTYSTGPNGMKLYVDGVQQGTATATVQSLTGYWRAGAETLSGWTGNPSDGYFDGLLDEVAVYSTALTSTRVTAHYTAATS